MSRARWSEMVLVVAFSTVSAGCVAGRGPNRDEPEAGQAIVADVNQISAVAGRPMIVPVRASPLARAEGDTGSWLPTHEPEISRQDGSPLQAQLRWFEAGPSEASPANWLPPTQMWSTKSWTDLALLNDAPSGPGFWGVMIDIGADRSARSVRLDGLPIPIRWIEPPRSMTDLARSPRLSASGTAMVRLGEKLTAEARDPMRRWRVRLISERFRAPALWPNGSPPQQADPALEALARQLEDRWRSALDEATRLDRGLGADVLNTLTAVVLSPDGELLPAWPLDDRESSRLQDTLLSRSSSDHAKHRAIEQWLSQHPPALAWVIDDAGRDGPADGESVRRKVTVGLCDLRGRYLAASIAQVGEAARTPTRLSGHSSVAAEVDVDLEPGGGDGAVMARFGDQSRALGVLRYSLQAEPPGLLIGPLIPQHNIATWRGGAPPRPDPRLATVARLSRATSRTWRLYIECNTGGAAPDPDDQVRLWLGARPAPEPIVLSPSGRSGDVDIGPTHWSALVDLPDWAIDQNNVLRLGLERVIPGVGRQSWPRPLLPGQLEPGKATIDLSAWASLAEPRDPASP